MQTRIAVIGSAESFDRIQSVSRQISNIELEGYIYQNPQEASQLLKQIKPCDVVFLAGTLPYLFTQKLHDQLSIPVVYLAQDEMTIASTLLGVLYHKQIPFERISIDLFDSQVVSNVLDAIDIVTSPLHMMDFKNNLLNEPFKFDELVTFHHSLWKNGEIDLAITSVHAVYNDLFALDVPVIRMADPKHALIRGLQEAKTKAEYVKSQAAQVAVGYISVNSSDDGPRKNIDTFAHKIFATVQEKDDSLFVLYSTRGDIEALRPDDFSFLEDQEIFVGFGYGATMKEAEKNALVALSFTEKNNHSCYILTENKDLLGPYPSTQNQQKLVNDHPDLYIIAQKAKLSPANLAKMIDFAKDSGWQHFTSADLADYLQVTRRSAERMIKKLTEHGYIQIVGEEMTYQQGRPRALYNLNIPIVY